MLVAQKKGELRPVQPPASLAESFLKMYGFAMLRTAGQNLYQVYHWPVHYLRINRYLGRLAAVDLLSDAKVNACRQKSGYA